MPGSFIDSNVVLLRLIGNCRLHPSAPSTVLCALDVAERFGFS
jgi:hypothetical protein